MSHRKGLSLIDEYGLERAEQIKNKIRLARLGKTSHRKGLNLIQEYGEEKAEEIRNKIKQTKEGKTYEEIYGLLANEKRQKKVEQGLFNNPFKGKHFTPEQRHRLSESIIINGKHKGINNPNFGKKYSQERLNQMRKITTERWQNPEFRDKCVRATMSALKLRPTKPERVLTSELGLFWRYVGDGKLIIGSKCPDFWNGDHKLIELFGDFWHRDHNPQDWVNYYQKFGYDCLVIWEHELKNLKQVREKVKAFSLYQKVENSNL